MLRGSAMSQPLSFAPIGYAESRFAEYAPSEEMGLHPSRIVVREEMASGLMGLSAGDSVLVLFHLHRAETYELQLHPGHDPSRPLRGCSPPAVSTAPTASAPLWRA